MSEDEENNGSRAPEENIAEGEEWAQETWAWPEHRLEINTKARARCIYLPSQAPMLGVVVARILTSICFVE